MPTGSPLSAGDKVLVVEDEARVRNMLSQALSQMGFRATFATSAEAAAKAIAADTFDIMILDLNLSGIGGIEFLHSLRKKQEDLQVIILTGFGNLEAAKAAIHLDVVEFLTKPCALGDLEIALDRARKRRKGQIVEAAAAEPALQFAQQRPAIAMTPPADGDPGNESLPLEEIERRHILSVLQQNNGVRTATAAALGISLRTLYYRLGQYQKQGHLP
jgi:DNA-binding NtrC family response regulator